MANLADYDETYRSFDWADARALLDGLPGGGLNIAHEAVDRHVAHGRGDHVALRLLGRGGDRREVNYAQLRVLTNRFANLLRHRGVQPGERVFLLCGRTIELYVGLLGALKAGCVVSPLFSAFGPEPIRQRLELGDARLLLTTPQLYERRVAGILEGLPALRHVVVTGGAFEAELEHAGDDCTITRTTPEDPALLHFTSGTTGTPKGALHVHDAVVAHHITGLYALDLHPDDVYWCTADPGWVTGTSYGVISPLTHGVTLVVDEAEFDADRWYRTLQDERVTVWYTAPTAIRMLMKVGADVAHEYDLSSVRFAASVGEPLNPDGVVWGTEAIGTPFHDNWWQTETGGIMIANYASLEIRPGSMGKPLPGIVAGLLRCDEQGQLARDADDRVVVVDRPDEDGMLALRPGWPSMFRTYLGEEERYRSCFTDGWYVTGDLARRDADGYYWFVGRADDVIKTAGHLIGPFEVESTLMAHPCVAEAGVYGVPDPVAGAVVHAVVVTKHDVVPSETLARELMAHARARLGAAVAPRWIGFAADLPKTRSGKVMRRLLRARELGLPEGDLSMLEGGTTT